MTDPDPDLDPSSGAQLVVLGGVLVHRNRYALWSGRTRYRGHGRQ